MARFGESSWKVLEPLGRCLCPLSGRALRDAARRRTGLEDFGEPPLEPALSVLLDGLEREADLHPLGRLLMRVHLRDLLAARLKLEAAWKTNRAALDAQVIRAPIFIIGMPRSGSTFLHELLAADPAHRAPRVWEVMFPLAAVRAGNPDRARCIRKAEACLWWFRRLARRADEVYPMRAETPHECVAIQSHSFLSQEFVSTCRLPTYEAFLRGADLTPAYAWEKRFLQHLQLEAPGRRWVLKSPDHVYGLKELFTVFPDAHILQTHRNPVEVLKSSVDLTRVLRGLFSRATDPEEVRAREARVVAEGTERSMQFRDGHPELAGRFIDVKYSELTADPLAAVRRIYAQLGTPLTEAAAARIGRLAAARSRYRGRRASAEPAGTRLEATPEIARFARYCSRFGLPFYETDLRR